MFNVRFGNFNKRKNSTAKPPSNFGAVFAVVLKDDCSLDSPVFLMTAATFDANYAVWGDKCFFVVDVVSERNNGWRVTCALDPLATYADQIKATSAFVEFATGGSTDIIDRRVVPTSPVTQAVATGNLAISQTGCYILSVVGKDGCVQYACSQSQLQSILAAVELWAATALSVGATEIDVLKIGFSQLISQGSALDAVRSCRWIPFDVSDLPTTPKTIYLGNYNTTITAPAITGLIKTFGVQITVPFSRTGWLRLQPYTDVFLYLPFVGVVNINNPYFQANDEVTINVSVNVVSGEIAYTVMIDSVIIGAYGGNCGASVDFGTTITPSLQMVNGIVSAATAVGIAGASMATGGAGGAAIASIGAANTVIAAAQGALIPQQSSVGGIQGGVGAGLVTSAAVWVYEHGTTGAIGNMGAVQGLPFFATARIGELSGYVQTKGASVSGMMHDNVYDAINAALDGGVFVE